MTTFNDFCAEWKVTPDERLKLAQHLATMRHAATMKLAEVCRFPGCKCPMDPGPAPDWCARGLPHAARGGATPLGDSQ